MNFESSEDFHEHVKFYRKFVRHGAQCVAAVAIVLALMALLLT